MTPASSITEPLSLSTALARECLASETSTATAVVIDRAYHNRDKDSELEIHRFLYEVNARVLLPSWHTYALPDGVESLMQARMQLEAAWFDADCESAEADVELPELPAGFADWALATCAADPSGPEHPLFDHLATTASRAQLREFVRQETPFDIHFADVVGLLLPGIHGEPKSELAQNFWDEMGHGDEAVAHRRLRIDMMAALDLDPALAYTEINSFWLEELKLANMYFHAGTHRRYVAQALGMMLATELMVPGRIERQAQGWNRVGLADADMRYLREHITVDVEHGQGWLEEVVVPLITDHPEITFDVALGMTRRLKTALAVCDRALAEFTGD